MEKIEWDISLETGIAEIDMQHRRLFNIVKILIDALDSNREDEVIDSILDELTRYTKYHTVTEEPYHTGNEDQKDEHRNLHLEFIEKVSGFKKLYRKISKREFSEFILKFLIDWIENHIKDMDMRDLPKK
jgi:hemerythrin